MELKIITLPLLTKHCYCPMTMAKCSEFQIYLVVDVLLARLTVSGICMPAFQAILECVLVGEEFISKSS